MFKRLAKALIRLHICAGWSEHLLSQIPHCRKSHVVAHIALAVSQDIIIKLLGHNTGVLAATLIFISGRGSFISSAQEGKSNNISNLVKS